MIYRIFSVFSILCLIISAIGLLGVSSILLINKTKEIGIRKVSGARVKEIISMINLDFIQWIILAIVLSCPFSWIIMNKWLENFTSHIKVEWWYFALAGITGILIAFITITLQSLKISHKNPVEALRYE